MADDELDDDLPQEIDKQIPVSSRIAAPGVANSMPAVSLRGLNVPVSSTAPASSSAPPETGSIADLEQKAATPIAPRPVAKPSATEARTAADDAELSRLQSTGSGVSQIAKAHPVAGGILRGLNTVGSIAEHVAPILGGVMTAIPGTEEHHNYLVRQQTGRLGNDLAEENKEAQTANENAQPEIKEQANEIKEDQLTENREKEQNKLDEQYRKLGLKRDTNGNLVPVTYDEMTPTEQAVHDLKTNQAEAADARAQLDQLKANPNSDLYKLQVKRLQIAEQNAQNAGKRLGLSEDQFQNKVQEQNLIKPSGQAQSRGSAAQAALDVLPELESQIRANAADLGPIMGRILKGEIAIGDVDPKIAKLYSSLNSFYALNPGIHGFRNYELVKDMPSFIGSLERDPEATIAALEGLKPTLQSVAKEGKTFHKRIVEGEGAGGASNSAKPGEGKTLTKTAIEQAAKANKISVADATKQAESQGYTIQ